MRIGSGPCRRQAAQSKMLVEGGVRKQGLAFNAFRLDDAVNAEASEKVMYVLILRGDGVTSEGGLLDGVRVMS